MTEQVERHAIRDKVARLIMLDHLQLLSDFDVDGDIYRKDPECAASAYSTADAIIAAMQKDAAMDRLVAEGQRCDAMTPQEAAKVLLNAMDGSGPFEPFMKAADAMLADRRRGLGPIPMLGSALRAISEDRQ